MYICDSEHASLYKYAKDDPVNKGRKKNDKTNAESLEYALWTNTIDDSSVCIRHYGLLSTPLHDRMMKCLPDLYTIYMYHYENNDDYSKSFKDVLRRCFSNKAGHLAICDQRVLGTEQYWQTHKFPLVGLLKVMQALKVKEFYSVPFQDRQAGTKRPDLFQCGHLVECDDPKYRFDSVKMSDKTNGQSKSGLITSFEDIKSVDGLQFLSAITIANHCFELKVDTAKAQQSKQLLKVAKNSYKAWKKFNQGSPYYALEEEPEEGDEEGEGRQPNTQNKSGKLSKKAFEEKLEPMRKRLNILDFAISEAEKAQPVSYEKIIAVKTKMRDVSNDWKKITNGYDMGTVDWEENRDDFNFKPADTSMNGEDINFEKDSDNDDDSSVGSGSDSD